MHIDVDMCVYIYIYIHVSESWIIVLLDYGNLV